MSDSWRMSAEDAEEYTRALGQIMSGGWRQIALAQRLGVPEAIGMTTEAWVRERIGGHVRLGLDERREAVKELTDPRGEFHLSQRQAAEVLGIGTMTVNRDLRDAPSGTAEAPPVQEGDETDVPDGTSEEFAEPSYEVNLVDTGVHPPGADDDDPNPPTVGDVLGEIAAGLDASGAFEAVDQEKTERAMRAHRLSWLRLVSEYPPGVLLDGLRAGEIRELIADLDRFITWLHAARERAATSRRPREVGA